ncbi:MAG: PIN domain-containing protein [Gammaproteobacteria bacterium]|nr:PIN domain-containing protein [Gammaproteobacteria bacterium]
MRAIIDVNVVLDVLLKRPSFHEASAKVLAAATRKELHGFYCAASVGDTYYVLTKAIKDQAKAQRAMVTLLAIVSICPVDEHIVKEAIRDGWPDLEDAIIHQSARAAGLDTIITRNGKDFAKSTLTVLTPGEVLTRLRN